MSLRIRITILISGFTALIVLIAGGVIHQLTQEDLHNDLKEKLYSQVTKVSDLAALVSILRSGRFYEDYPQVVERRPILKYLLDPQIPTRILVGQETIIATRGFPDFTATSLRDGFSEAEASGKNWSIRTQTLRLPESHSLGITEAVTIQVAISRDSLNTTLQNFRARFFLIGILALFGAGIGGWLLGGVALQPLNRLRRYTEGVRDSQDLSQRVPEKLGPAEVETLAKSLNEMLSELELNVEKTEQALISSRAFASNAAHELRTPLTSMRVNLDLLVRHTNVDPEERSKILGNIISGQDRLLSTLESLRLLSRGDLSEGDVFEEIDFVQLIRDIVSRHQNQWPDVNIHVYLPPTPPLVFGWLEGLAVLFRNVIENSCVHAGIPNQDLVIDFSVEARGEELHVNMDDNGVGIPESERDQVLERFNRGSNSMGTGSGLGLSLVKQQVELHGGSVKLSDSPSGGTRVSIVLPIILLRCQGYCQ